MAAETDSAPAVIDKNRDAPDTVETPAPPPDDSPEAGIEALRQQIADSEARVTAAEKQRERADEARQSERSAREEAERRSAQYRQEADTGRQSAAEAQYDSVVNALAAAQGDLSSYKSGLKTAMAEGDFDKVAELSAEIGMAAARVREFESGKLALEQRRNAGGDQRQAGGDERENYIQSRTPRTASWLRRNDRFFTDRNFQGMVQGAHALAIGRGIEPDSDDYFSFIEEQAGLRQPAAAASALPAAPAAPAVSTAATTTQRSSPTPAAPAAGNR